MADGVASQREGGMDWTQWGEKVGRALSGDEPGGLRGLFASGGGDFTDPVNETTQDLRGIERQTRDHFPDWRQEVTAVFGGDRGGAFEWIGSGTLGGEIPILIHGCTMVEVDSDGLVTRWRDYFDMKEIEKQVRKAKTPTETEAT
jgi:hypothetical protein